jgi:hypothetical protein
MVYAAALSQVWTKIDRISFIVNQHTFLLMTFHINVVYSASGPEPPLGSRPLHHFFSG